MSVRSFLYSEKHFKNLEKRVEKGGEVVYNGFKW